MRRIVSTIVGVLLFAIMNNMMVVVSAFVIGRPISTHTPNSTPRLITRPIIRSIMKPTNPSNTLLHAEEGKNNNLLDNIEQFLIGNLFVYDNDNKENNNGNIQNKEDPQKELAIYSNLAHGNQTYVTFAHKSLSSYLLQYGKMLAIAEGIEKLPTPIVAFTFIPQTTNDDDDDDDDIKISKDENDNDNNNDTDKNEDEQQPIIIQTSGIKLSFLKQKRYLSRNEQKGLEKGFIPDRKGAKIDSWSPGGIELLVQTISVPTATATSSSSIETATATTTTTTTTTPIETREQPPVPPQQQLQLLVRRCDIDKDTVIKVSSERTIVRRIGEAIRIWNKMRSI